MKFNKGENSDEFKDEEIIRKIYISLGKKFSYNRDYIYNFSQSEEIYEKTIMPGVLEKLKSPNKIKVTCKQIADSLARNINNIPENSTKEKILAKPVGYRKNEEMHVGTLVTIGKKNYYLDLYKDLYRIQRGMQTKYFAPLEENLEKIKQQYPSVRIDIECIKLESINENQLRKMDLKNGDLEYGVYVDDAIEMMKNEMKEENLKEYVKDYNNINSKEERNKIILKWKIEYIFKYIKNELLESNIGISEIDKVYKKIYYSLLTKEEKASSMLCSIDIHTKDEEENKKEGIIFKIYINGEELNYIYESGKDGFTKISKEELEEKSKKGILSYDGFEK